MDRTKEIRRLLRDIAGANVPPYTILTGQVQSVQGETCTISRDGVTYADVRLGAVVDGNANNLIIKPTVGSYVLLADLSDGKLRDLAIIGWSQIDIVSINNINAIVLNGGNLGGMVRIGDLTTKLNALTDRVNALIEAYNTHTHPVSTTGTAAAQAGTAAATTATAQTAPSFSASDYEDTKIKH